MQTVGRADGPYCKVASLYSRPFAARRVAMSPPSVKGEAEEDWGRRQHPARARSARSSTFLVQMKGFGKIALVFACSTENRQLRRAVSDLTLEKLILGSVHNLSHI